MSSRTKSPDDIAYAQGYTARLENKPQNSNPYTQDTLRNQVLFEEWDYAWRQASSDIKFFVDNE